MTSRLFPANDIAIETQGVLSELRGQICALVHQHGSGGNSVDVPNLMRKTVPESKIRILLVPTTAKSAASGENTARLPRGVMVVSLELSHHIIHARELEIVSMLMSHARLYDCNEPSAAEPKWGAAQTKERADSTNANVRYAC